MGKCTRKPRTSGDISAMDASLSFGVRTRAKMLSLQRLPSPSSANASPQPEKPDYLELRSRRLQKLPLLGKYFRNSRNVPAASEQGIVRGGEENPRIETSPEKHPSESGFSTGRDDDWGGYFERRTGGCEVWDSEIEVSSGENILEMDARKRTTKKSSPCSLIRTADIPTMPGSSTKCRTHTATNRRLLWDTLGDIPTADEIEAFFALAEQPQQHQFVEKYNFDILNDMPLPGRNEWMRVTPCAESKFQRHKCMLSKKVDCCVP